MDGTGISGENGGDDFIDAKGNDCVIKNNTVDTKGNSFITDAFQVHAVVTGWGTNNDFSGNTIIVPNSTPYIINVLSGNAKSHGNTRSTTGNMYKGSVTQY